MSSNVLLKVFNVVGVAVASGLTMFRPLFEPVKLGARSDVFSDNFGLFSGDIGFKDRRRSEVKRDREGAGSRRGIGGAIDIASMVVSLEDSAAV